MADKKVSELTALTTPNQKDLLLVVDDPSGTPVSKRITLKSLFGSVPANTTINGTLTVNANTTQNGNKVTVVANTTFSKTTAGQVKINSGVVTLGKKTTVIRTTLQHYLEPPTCKEVFFGMRTFYM